MLTARDIAKAHAILNAFEKATLSQLSDPTFTGTLQARAVSVRVAFEIELEKHNVPIKKEEEVV